MIYFLILKILFTTLHTEAHSFFHEIDCQNSKTKTSTFWKKQVKDQLEIHLDQSQLKGAKREVYRNLLITKKYLRLYEESNNEIVSYMGYTYAHASHHLGRLVRYHVWDGLIQDGDLGALQLSYHDKRLIKGFRLKNILKGSKNFLPKRLMYFSQDLFIQLYWNLWAAQECGLNHLLSPNFKGLNKNIKKAYESNSIDEFIRHYIYYEQEYLQKRMYSKVDIKLITKAGVLDKFRFIPFNGQKNLSFRSWCDKNYCKSSSYDLKSRADFDHYVISNEFPYHSYSRLENSQIKKVISYFENNL